MPRVCIIECPICETWLSHQRYLVVEIILGKERTDLHHSNYIVRPTRNRCIGVPNIGEVGGSILILLNVTCVPENLRDLGDGEVPEGMLHLYQVRCSLSLYSRESTHLQSARNLFRVGPARLVDIARYVS